MTVTGSSSGQPQFIASTGGNRNFSNAPLIENSDTDQIVVPDLSFYMTCPFFFLLMIWRGVYFDWIESEFL